MSTFDVVIVGAGLAGSEAAYQIAKRGFRVRLYEMRPKKTTPAHKTAMFSELVCSNSLRATSMENAVGLLKEEMRCLDSLIMVCADACKVPAGGALAVDRELFSKMVTEKLENHPLIEVVREEVLDIPSDSVVILASGPLTSESLAKKIMEYTGKEYFYFYDAVAPIVAKDSIDMDKVFISSRYDKGDADYINCPMNKEEYQKFYSSLVEAEKAPRKEFDKEVHFEGCMPIEALATRGEDTMRYGPLKPVGLVNPHTGERPYAVVQLRQDNAVASLYNIVGFQTGLSFKAQKEVFSLIPGLEKAEFVRLGVMHRNTYLNSPMLLEPTLACKARSGLFFAGQITGVEGYVESASSGLIAGINAVAYLKGESLLTFPPDTAHGALCHYIVNSDLKKFQPMNVAFGIFPPLEEKIRDKKKRKLLMANRGLESLEKFIDEHNLKN